MFKVGDKLLFIGKKEEVKNCFGWNDQLNILHNTIVTVSSIAYQEESPYMYIGFEEIPGKKWGMPKKVFRLWEKKDG